MQDRVEENLRKIALCKYLARKINTGRNVDVNIKPASVSSEVLVGIHRPRVRKQRSPKWTIVFTLVHFGWKNCETYVIKTPVFKPIVVHTDYMKIYACEIPAIWSKYEEKVVRGEIKSAAVVGIGIAHW